MNQKLRGILKYHRSIFLGDGNAVPAPARGVVCDLDVGDAKPIAQRSRQVAPRHLVKVYELLKKFLETGLIEFSDSDWASAIVIVFKKNGKDIRLCIDYRMVNQLIKLSYYPLPLIDDLLIGFEEAMWFMSLDMASGFWAVPMPARAKLIFAFICPFGHFQWVRMPFGLKNAPLIYQQMLNNCLWGFVRLPAEEEAKVDQDVLDFLGIKVDERPNPEAEEEIPALTTDMTVFQRNIPAPLSMSPVLGRSSYIDDIAHGAPTWDKLCSDLNALLFRLRYWGISVSLPKSEFGKLSIPYLSHEISAEGLGATPKIAKVFLGSINYYNKFIEDRPVVASVLYKLTEEQVREGRDLWRAKEAFEILKKKIISTPLLRHPDRGRYFVIILHANPWAACAVLGQEYDGVIFPVRKGGYSVATSAEGVLHFDFGMPPQSLHAILRVALDFSSSSLEGRCLKWATMLAPWDLEIHRVENDEDGLAAIMGAGITPREHFDKVAESLIPNKGRVVPAPPISLEMLEEDYSGYLLSFDGAAKTSDKRGSCGCILWKLPEWNVVSARGFALSDATVNEAEYHGMIKGITMALEKGIFDLVMVGDSRVAVQQAQGLINCNELNLQRKLAVLESLKQKIRSVKLVHVKREFNQAADYLTARVLRTGESQAIDDPSELSHLSQVNRIPEKLMCNPDAKEGDDVSKTTRSQVFSAMMDKFPDSMSAPLPMSARIFAAVTRSQARAVPAGVPETEPERPAMNPLESKRNAGVV